MADATRDEEDSAYSMLQHPQPTDSSSQICTRKVKAFFVIFLVATLCVILILTIIVPLSEGESVHRKYYLSCSSIEWDYTPWGRNMVQNREFTSDEERFSDCFDGGENKTIFKKKMYQQYVDSTFSQLISQPATLGLVGPMIRAKVGDEISIFLKNDLADEDCGITIHGLKAARSQDVDEYASNINEDGDVVETQPPFLVSPKETKEYKFLVPDRAGPPPNGHNSRAWIYHGSSHSSVNDGLFGVAVISGQYSATDLGAPEDVVDEVIIALSNFDESSSPDTVGEKTDNLNVKHTINGWLYGNAPFPFSVPSEGRTRWYVTSTGYTAGHSIYWHGNAVQSGDGVYRDVVDVAAMEVLTLDMDADNIGTWLITTTDYHQAKAGLQALYEVK